MVFKCNQKMSTRTLPTLLDVKNILQSIILSSPQNTTIQQLNSSYKNSQGRNIPFTEFGFNSLEHFLKSITDVLIVDGHGFGALVSSVQSNRNEYIHNLIRRQAGSKKMEVKSSEMSVLEMNRTKEKSQPPKESVRRENSSSLKLNNTRKIDDQNSLSFDGNLLNNNKFQLSTECEQSSVEDSAIELESDAIPSNIDMDLLNLFDFPPYVANYSVEIPPLEIPENIRTGKHFSVFITEIHNPFRFWFHYAENYDINDIDHLMQDMETTYNKMGDNELEMYPNLMKPGLLCAVAYTSEKLWHRAEILKIPKNDRVKVLFIDYGTVDIVSLDNVKFLLEEFCKLSRQALRGSLMYIEPADGFRWIQDATISLLDMVSDLEIYAVAKEVDEKHRIHRLVLIDSHTGKHFNINEALVIKGHAKFQDSYKSYESPDKMKPEKERNMHPQETFPTFEMLEKGEYPNFADIGFLLAKGVDIIEIENGGDFSKINDELESFKVFTSTVLVSKLHPIIDVDNYDVQLSDDTDDEA